MANGDGISIAFSNFWNDTSPTWTRIDDPTVPALSFTGSGATAKSHAVSYWETHRGRSYELDKTQAGTATIRVVDTTGLFDPTSSSPYSLFLTPMRQGKINVQNPHTGAYSDIFTGFIESYNWTITQDQKLMTLDINLVDGFEPLGRVDIPVQSNGVSFLSADLVHDRITGLLQAGEWPSAWWNVFSGNVYVNNTKYSAGTTVLTGLEDAADAEFPGVANIFMDASGIFNFRGRLARFNFSDYEASGPTNRSLSRPAVAWSAGDLNAAYQLGIAPISNIEWIMDTSHIYNAVLSYPNGMTQSGLATQLVTDSTSISQYGARLLTLDNLLTVLGHDSSNVYDVDAATETARFAHYYVNNYKDPQTRISNLTFKTFDPNLGTPGAQLWLLLCNAEIGDKITIYTTNPGGGGFNAQSFYIEGVHNAVNPLTESFPDWTMTLDVSPVQYYTSFPDPA